VILSNWPLPAALSVYPGRGSGASGPGCWKSNAEVARLYMATPGSAWPKPTLDLKQEIAFYRGEFAKMKGELAGIEFPVDELVTSRVQSEYSVRRPAS